jgi:hypothetical protein
VSRHRPIATFAAALVSLVACAPVKHPLRRDTYAEAAEAFCVHRAQAVAKRQATCWGGSAADWEKVLDVRQRCENSNAPVWGGVLQDHSLYDPSQEAACLAWVASSMPCDDPPDLFPPGSPCELALHGGYRSGERCFSDLECGPGLHCSKRSDCHNVCQPWTSGAYATEGEACGTTGAGPCRAPHMGCVRGSRGGARNCKVLPVNRTRAERQNGTRT